MDGGEHREERTESGRYQNPIRLADHLPPDALMTAAFTEAGLDSN